MTSEPTVLRYGEHFIQNRLIRNSVPINNTKAYVYKQ